MIFESQRLTGPRRAGHNGGGPPYADDMVGSEGGWGVPVQPVRQAGELGVEGSNRVESPPNGDCGALQIWRPRPSTVQVSEHYFTV